MRTQNWNVTISRTINGRSRETEFTLTNYTRSEAEAEVSSLLAGSTASATISPAQN